MTVPTRRILAVGIFLCLAASAQAQVPHEPVPLTVEEAVRLALDNNPSLRAAARDARGAESGVRSARALAPPEIVFTPAITPGGSDEELLISQPLEINGTRSARAGVAGARLRGSRAAALVTLRDTVFEAESAYYELARARRLESVARDTLATVTEMDRVTSRQVELGSRAGVDRTQTGIEVARARQQVDLAEGQAAAALAALNAVMGRLPDTPVGPLTVPDAPVEDPNVESLTRQALAARADVARTEAERDEHLQEARLARAEGRPDIAPQFRAGSLTRGVHETGIGVGITLPLVDYGARRGRVRQAEQSARAGEDRIAARRNAVRRDVAQAVARLRAANAVLSAYPGGVLDQSRRLLEASQVGFQSGQTSVLALLEAQRTHRAVQAEYANALADRALAVAELKRATAAVPTDLLPSVPPSGRIQ